MIKCRYITNTDSSDTQINAITNFFDDALPRLKDSELLKGSELLKLFLSKILMKILKMILGGIHAIIMTISLEN